MSANRSRAGLNVFLLLLSAALFIVAVDPVPAQPNEGGVDLLLSREC